MNNRAGQGRQAHLEHRVEGTGGHALQAAPAPAHIKKGAIIRVKSPDCVAPTDLARQATLTVTTKGLVDEQGKGNVSSSRHEIS
jgi:hypothetical protein